MGEIALKLFYIFLLILGFAFIQPTYAELSCDELDEVSEVVDYVADEFDDMSSRRINDEVDDALLELTDALKEVALEEDDRRLTAWINDLEIAWEDMEKDDFVESLDDISERLDELYDRDCTRR